jgi:hypothetical protein
MPKPTITITELSEFEPTRVDGVGKGANGFPILMLKSVDDDASKAERPACETCDGEGKIMAGHRKCPDCQGTGKKPMVGDTTKTLADAASKEAGVAPSGSGATPANDCPTCEGDGIIKDGTHDGKPCPDCGGTGKDQARTNQIELNEVPGFGGSVTEGDALGRERIDKGSDPDGFRPAPYKADPDETVQCPKCERMNDLDAAYCDQCGHELMGDDEVRVGATKAEMSAADINDLPDSAFAHIEPGGKKDDEGKTVPRSLRHFPIHDAAHVRNALARLSQSPHGDDAESKVKAAAKKFGIEVSDDASKADGSFSGMNPAMTGMAASTSDDSTPGSPAWEAVDAETATSAALALMQASEFIRTFAQRESMEVAAGEGNDIFDASAAEAAIMAVSQALGIMAQLAFHESQEAQKGQIEKAGKRLSSKTVSVLAAARDHLNGVLGDDDPAKQKEDDDSNSAADKFIASANKAISGKDVLDMTEDELKTLVVETVAQAVVAAEAVKGKSMDDNADGIEGGKAANKKSKAKMPKSEDTDLEDEAEQGDEESASTPASGAAKAEMSEEELAAHEAAEAARKEFKAARKAEKQIKKQAEMAKAVEEALAKAEEQRQSLESAVETLTAELNTVKQMAAPSTIVRTRPQEAVTKSAERDALDLEIAKYENLAKSTTDPDLRKGYLDRIKSIRTQIAAI